MSRRSSGTSAPRSCHSQSWSSQSTQDTQPSSDDDSQPSTPSKSRLMPKPPPDAGIEGRLARVAQFRRSFKRHVFDDVAVDWRSLPVVEESELHRTHLLMRPHMRCDSSPAHRARIIAEARAMLRIDDDDLNFDSLQIGDDEHADDETEDEQQHHNNQEDSQPHKRDLVVSRDSHQNIVMIAGTEVVDMIG